ncbi:MULTISPECIES: hypothetical protein [Nocardioides]|uniref:Twin-arginine translocation signal domain-containing protein n=1 Tax=Nocardioides vastitatis TaxID=2568655 RepID=A0ABW0ZIU7_9ACTN|nr:hypothetical protein [Nocardioides sp.]THJ06246.1 hypothetical protein E7Z54_06435 [Nocardioides sp.]
MMSEISRRSMLAGIGGLGAFTVGLGSVGTATAAQSPDVTTEEWLLGTLGASSALGGTAQSIQSELPASTS